jgi:hypothetical protein
VEYEDDIDEGMGHKGGRSPTQQSSPWHHSGKTSERTGDALRLA